MRKATIATVCVLLVTVSALSPAAAGPVGRTIDRTDELADDTGDQAGEVVDDADDLQGPAGNLVDNVTDDPPNPTDPSGTVGDVNEIKEEARDGAVDIKNAVLKGATAIKNALLKGLTAIKNAALESATTIKNTTLRSANAVKNALLNALTHAKNAVLRSATETKNEALRSTTQAKNDAVRKTTDAKNQALRSASSILYSAQGWAGATTWDLASLAGPWMDLVLDIAEPALFKVAEPCNGGWRVAGGDCRWAPVTYSSDGDDGSSFPTSTAASGGSSGDSQAPAFGPSLPDKQCDQGKFGWTLRNRAGDLKKGCTVVKPESTGIETHTVHWDGGTVTLSMTADQDDNEVTLNVDQDGTSLHAVRITVEGSGLEYHYLDNRGGLANHPGRIEATLSGVQFNGETVCPGSQFSGKCIVVDELYTSPTIGPHVELDWATAGGLAADTTRFYFDHDLDDQDFYGAEIGVLHSASNVAGDESGNPADFEATMDLETQDGQGDVLVNLPSLGNRNQVSLAVHAPPLDAPLALALVKAGSKVDLHYDVDDGGGLRVEGDLVFPTEVATSSLTLEGLRVELHDLPTVRGLEISTTSDLPCSGQSGSFDVCARADDVESGGAKLEVYDDGTRLVTLGSIPTGKFYAVLGPGSTINANFYPGDDSGANIYTNHLGGMNWIVLAGVERIYFEKGCGVSGSTFDAKFTRRVGGPFWRPYLGIYDDGKGSGGGGSGDSSCSSDSSDGGGSPGELSLAVFDVKRLVNSDGLRVDLWETAGVDSWLYLRQVSDELRVEIDADRIRSLDIFRNKGAKLVLAGIEGDNAEIHVDAYEEVEDCNDNDAHLTSSLTPDGQGWDAYADLDIDGPCGAVGDSADLTCEDDIWTYTPWSMDVLKYDVDC